MSMSILLRNNICTYIVLFKTVSTILRFILMCSTILIIEVCNKNYHKGSKFMNICTGCNLSDNGRVMPGTTLEIADLLYGVLRKALVT